LLVDLGILRLDAVADGAVSTRARRAGRIARGRGPLSSDESDYGLPYVQPARCFVGTPPSTIRPLPFQNLLGEYQLKGLISGRFDAWRRGVGIEKLFVSGWCGSVATILVALIALFFAFGFWWPYWRAGDMDMWMVYEAFLFNDGLRQEYFDHPGYLTILLLGHWFGVLHVGDLLPVHALSELPPVTNVSASALAWMRATQAARVLSLFIGLAFVTAFAYLLRALVRDWRVAALAAFALAFSGGFMMESRIVRAELIASGFAYSALLISLIAAQSRGSLAGWRPFLIGVAALFATLAMLNKVQILFLVAAIPPIVFLFGCQADEAPSFWRSRGRAVALTGVFVTVAAFATALAWPIAMSGFFDAPAVADRVRSFGSGLPIYQTLIGVWVLVWMVAYAVLFRVSGLESISAAAAVVAGIGIGLLVLALHLNTHNAVVVMNPLEKMLAFAAGSDPGLVRGGTISGGSFVHALLDGFGLLLARQTFFLSSSPRPTIFLEWIVLVAVVFAWRRGERKIVFQVGALMAVVWAIDLIGTFRGLKLEYFIITDPLVIIAAAWLLAKVPSLQSHRWTYRVVLSLLVVTVCVGLAEPVKHTFKRDMPLDFCVPHYPYTQRIERFSFCPP
jgi:hypothetical protein